MSAQEFGGRVDDDVGAERGGALEDGPEQGVVDDRHHIRPVMRLRRRELPAHRGDRRDVAVLDVRVGGSLHKQRAHALGAQRVGRRPHRLGHAVPGGDEAHVDAKGREYVPEEVVRTGSL